MLAHVTAADSDVVAALITHRVFHVHRRALAEQILDYGRITCNAGAVQRGKAVSVWCVNKSSCKGEGRARARGEDRWRVTAYSGGSSKRNNQRSHIHRRAYRKESLRIGTAVAVPTGSWDRNIHDAVHSRLLFLLLRTHPCPQPSAARPPTAIAVLRRRPQKQHLIVFVQCPRTSPAAKKRRRPGAL